MIKCLILDDGYHDKEVIVSDRGFLKLGLATFVADLAKPHVEHYWLGTIHYEDIEEDASAELFETLSKMPYGPNDEDADYEFAFERLFKGPDVVDGCDIY